MGYNFFHMKKLIIFLMSFVFLFSFSQNVFAVTYTKKVVPKATATPLPTPTPTPLPEKVNSFEVFWPMVAGKTVESKFYSLKLLKEKLRGILIFGKSQKAGYQVFLGTKRVLEAEYLLISGKKDLANITLEKADSSFGKAIENLKTAKEKGVVPDSIKTDISEKITNLTKLVKYLLSQYPDNQEKLQNVLDKLDSISASL